MHLKRLTLKGFKSFAKPTTLEFEPGVTCVVGPNGSGKSNVVDALAWVMGEQGAKSLRGGKMEDVIFAGTATRGPLGRAEVTLTIDNSDGALPIDYSEVTIQRTLFRTGGSEYAINGEHVRLLDVQELLSDSGLGREMHVIVGQGRLDTVLRATPEERRGFVEEAAGVLKHRRRKEKTVRKLEGMEQNLQRLRDLVTEVRRQLKPLGRQAEVARRAQEIAAVARDAKARLMADDVQRLRQQLRDANSTEQARSTERMVLKEKLDRAVLRIQQIQQSQRSDAVDAARRVAFDLESVRERVQNFHMLVAQRESLLEARLAEPALSVSVSSQAIDDAAEQVRELETRSHASQQQWEAAKQATVTARATLDDLDREIAAQSALLSQHELRTTELQGKADAAASRLAAVRGEVLRSEHAHRAANDRLETARQKLAEAESQASDGEADSHGLDEAYEQAQQAVSAAQQVVDELRDREHELRRERDALDARASALALAAQVNDGAQALLASNPAGVRGRLSDVIRVEPGYERAIAAALGATADAIVTETAERALELISGDASAGRLHLVAAFVEAAADPAMTAEIAGADARIAADLVQGADALTALLQRTVVVPELPDAAGAAALLRALPNGARLVSMRGDVLDAGTLVSGSDDTESGASRIELVAERERALAELETVDTQLEDIGGQLADRRAELQRATGQSDAALAKLRGFDAELASRREQLNRAKANVESATAELARAEKSHSVAGANVDEAVARADAAKHELEVHQSQPRPMLDASRRESFVAELERAREAEVEARLQVETLRERLRSEQLRVRDLETQREAEREAAEKAARETVLRRRDLERTRAVLARIPQLAEHIDASLKLAQAELHDRQRERSEQDQQLGELRRDEQQLRTRLTQITEDVHQLELQIYERKLQLSNILERAASELSLSEAVLLAEYAPDAAPPQAGAVAGEDGAASDVDTEGAETEGAAADLHDIDDAADASERPVRIVFDRKEQETRLATAERDLQRLGRINPLALEEFAALEQRHTYLQEQLDDLTQTRADLMQIVSDIDTRMREVFAAAFADTREAFHEVFPVLFPGGSGDISLTNPDDMLTTGIEVAVKPAGKKIDKLSLLSGGERSLVAVALLVAIFKARPSPFYIMDEVEAALDDANLGRLLEVFENLRDSSQLIVITHQKRTMEIADALYGVSMHRDGVSTVVGQRVRELTKREERAADGASETEGDASA
ncbi:chromosome segregation protein SMC [Gulosibacter bifidus]|uniref:Chromosome partition protein Smc n=1 Tax=Gulosibacter bifidus TaxID=272239 RepID=A0ABW5RJG4_9MICO|nr:chromosome segregation protein SMC [Gulosibacter bifidus]